MARYVALPAICRRAQGGANLSTKVPGLKRAKRAAERLLAKPDLGPQHGAGRFTPPPPPVTPERDTEALDVWGFADTRFEVNAVGDVTLAGSRYDLSGQSLPHLLPWIRGVMQLPIEAGDQHPSEYPPKFPKAKRNTGFLKAVADLLPAEGFTQDGAVRLRHGHGHTQEEMYRIKYGELGRIPDLVVYPTGEDEVVELVAAAARHDVSLIPYGGGTSVTEALRCPADEKRLICSVDMTRMNRILWIDPTNRMACVQAGAVGRVLMDQLAEYGVTMGHEPDSVEFSTLGGWIATHASGMKKNRYGNIEDLVLDVNLVTPTGRLARSGLAPRESIGFDPKRTVLGSEGRLGIITQAVVKLFPLPEAQNFGSILFPEFGSGVAFLYELQRTQTLPSSVRLVDNLQFKFGQALKPASPGGLGALKSKLEKLVVTKVKGFDPDEMVACTLVFEGTADEVERQEAAVYALAKRHGGMAAGGANGARGYQLTFGIAYIRDFIMNHYVLAESFETSVPWSEALTLCENVKQRLYDEHAARQLPGIPFVTCRVTQLYDTGVAIYFYFAYHHKGVDNPTAVYHQLENAARDEILRCGGSLSHHHGVGKIRQDYLSRVMSEEALAWSQRTKDALDPMNIFGCGNQTG
jgi:alkyldihydroxyacetonephosphate synthase